MLQAADYAAIQNLVHAYAYALDHGDLDGLAALFAHADVRLTRTSPPISKDPAAVRQAFVDWLRLYDDVPRTRHAMTNLQVWPDGPDRARATCYVMVFQETPALPLQPIIGGDYQDVFEKLDGVWRFAERTIHNDLIGNLSSHGRYGFPGARPPPACSTEADIEAIRQLKACYFRCLDTKAWEAMEDLFAHDAVLDSREALSVRDPATGRLEPPPLDQPPPRGPRAIVEALRVSTAGLQTIHHGFNPEIILAGPTEASGVWAMEDRLYGGEGAPFRRLHGFGHYNDSYVLGPTGWLIRSSRLTRVRVEID